MAGLQNSDNKSLENRLKKFCALASLLAYVTKTKNFSAADLVKLS